MSLRADALSARNVILLAVAVLIISLVWMWASVLAPNDSGGVARDTYGTRAHGYRALFELLDELGASVFRRTSPPGAGIPVDHTVILLSPQAQLVVTAPKHLYALRQWVEQGGRLIVAPSVRDSQWIRTMTEAQVDQLKGSPTDILDALDLDDSISINERAGFRVDSPLTSDDDGPKTDQPHWIDDEGYDFLPGELREAWKNGDSQAEYWPVTAGGSLKNICPDVRRLALPAEGFAAIEADQDKLDGAVVSKVDDETSLILAAAVSRGKGEIIVIAEPLILANFYLPKADNSVMAARLLAANVAGVVFDEFYHGLAVRGNAFYLLTYPSFALIAIVVLAGVIAWAWQSATFLGPPLSTRDLSRRTIAEYVDAMARFLSRGEGSRRFLIQETREGVLRELCQQLQLALDTTDAGRVIAKLEHRDPRRAEKLSSILREIDRRLAANTDYPRTNFLPDVQRLTACL